MQNSSPRITCLEELMNADLSVEPILEMGSFQLRVEGDYVSMLDDHIPSNFEKLVALAGLGRADIVAAYGYTDRRSPGIWPTYKTNDFEAARRALALLYKAYDDPACVEANRLELEELVEDATHVYSKLKKRISNLDIERNYLTRELSALGDIIKMHDRD